MLPGTDSLDSLRSFEDRRRSSTEIIEPPEVFSGEESATPTPQVETESTGRDSDATITPTPRMTPIDACPVSPSNEELRVRISGEKEKATLVPPPDDERKRDSIGPSIKVLTVIASPEPALEDDFSLEGEDIQSYTLTRVRHPSATSTESDVQEFSCEPQVETKGIEPNTIDEGTDL